MILWACSLVVNGAIAADLTVTSTYYTSGAEVREDLNLRNTDYLNSIYIDQRFLGSEFSGNGDGNAPNHVEHDISIITNQPFGASLKVDAENFDYGGYFQTEGNGGVDFSYAFDSGQAQAEIRNQFASLREIIATDASRYQSTIASSSKEQYLQGIGSPIDGGKSSFTSYMVLEKLGKLCRIDAYLSTGDDKSQADLPVEYTWITSGAVNENYADMGVNLKALEGNRAADFQLKGISSELSDKYSPLNGKAAHLDAVVGANPFYALRVSKELDMKYEINN